MGKKLLVGAALLGGVVLVAIAVAFFVDFDSPELGEAVLEKANEATGVQLTVERYRLNLIRGLELEDVEATSSLPGGVLKAHLDGLVLKHRLLPLLTGRVAVEQILLLGPEVELIEGAAKGKKRAAPKPKRESKSPSPESSETSESGESGDTGDEPPPEPSEGGGLALEISEILIEDGSIRMRREGTDQGSTSIEGLDVRLRDLSFDPRALSPLHGISAKGSLGIRELTLDATQVREVRGQLEMDQGQFGGQGFRFSTDEGRFLADLTVDFNRIPFGYTLSLRGDPLDVNAIARSGKDGGFSPGRLEFEAEGFGTDSKGIRGKGVLRLEEGKLPATPVLAGLEKALGRGTSLVGSPYKATDAPFRIEKNQFILERFQLETPQAAIDLKGTAHLDGPLSLNLILKTPREGLVIKEVPNEVLDALTDDEGWVAIPFRITGTRDEPKVLPDAKALLAGRGTQKLLEQGIKSFLQKKFD
jgi:hypothetical protein